MDSLKAELRDTEKFRDSNQNLAPKHKTTNFKAQSQTPKPKPETTPKPPSPKFQTQPHLPNPNPKPKPSKPKKNQTFKAFLLCNIRGAFVLMHVLVSQRGASVQKSGQRSPLSLSDTVAVGASEMKRDEDPKSAERGLGFGSLGFGFGFEACVSQGV